MVHEFRNRALKKFYPFVFVDAGCPDTSDFSLHKILDRFKQNF